MGQIFSYTKMGIFFQCCINPAITGRAVVKYHKWPSLRFRSCHLVFVTHFSTHSPIQLQKYHLVLTSGLISSCVSLGLF